MHIDFRKKKWGENNAKMALKTSSTDFFFSFVPTFLTVVPTFTYVLCIFVDRFSIQLEIQAATTDELLV